MWVAAAGVHSKTNSVAYVRGGGAARMAERTSGRTEAGRSGNTEPKSKRGRGMKDVRGVGKVCGVGVVSSGVGVAAARVGGDVTCDPAQQDDGDVRIRQDAGDVTDRVAWGRGFCDRARA